MPSTPSRRQLLAAAGLAGASGLAYGADRLWRGATDASFDGLMPVEGTWPLERYDTANTAHNPFASPPRERPTRRRTLTPGTDDDRYAPLVSNGHLAVYGTGCHLYRPGEDSPVWSDNRETPVAGFGPAGDLYGIRARPSATGETDTVFRVDTDGEPSVTSTAPYPESNVDGFLVGQGELYAGTATSRDLTAFRTESDRSWQVDGVMPAVAGDRLYTAGGMDGLSAYEERSGLDEAVTVGPTRRWTTELYRGEPHLPAVADGRVAVGTFGIHDHDGVLAAVDAATGERLWEPRDFGMDVSTPALSGTTGFVAAGTDGLERGVVAAVDMPSGETIWRDDVDWYAFSPVVGGQTLVVAGEIRAGESAPAGVVRAYDTSSGEVLWTVEGDFDPDTLALVDDRVLVGGVGGVIEYR